MGFPSSSFEGMYRNSMDDIKRFFKKYHEDHYKVYNLCAEKAYKPSEFGNSCVNYPFPDHNPCPFSMIIAMMEDCHKYLAEDKKNAIAIHVCSRSVVLPLLASAFVCGGGFDVPLTVCVFVAWYIVSRVV